MPSKLHGKGDLPKDCPNCKEKDVDWNWEMTNFYDDQITNEAICPKCETMFEEVMKVVSWNEKENN